MTQLRPEIVGYHIEKFIGSGGQAQVWRALQKSLNRPVALKLLRADLVLDAEALLREARLAGSVAHPHVVHVHDCGQQGNVVFIAQEWVEGVDAGHLLRQRGGRLPLGEALRIMRDIALGAAAIADAGLVHRDIKPANILVTPEGVAKLADLGSAYRQAGGRTLTATGAVVGTPQFMAPEQARGEADLDVRCDVYALGATFFTLLTGQPLVGGDNALDVMTKVASVPTVDLSERAPWLPPMVIAHLRAATAFDRAHRLAHPTLIAEDLTDLIEQRMPRNSKAVQRRVGYSRWKVPLLAACLTLVSGLCIGTIWGAWNGIRPATEDSGLTRARQRAELSDWQSIREHATGNVAIEADQALRLLADIAAARQPLITAPALKALPDDLEAQATHIAEAEAALKQCQKDYDRACEEKAARIKNPLPPLPPLPPENVDMALVAERVREVKIPGADHYHKIERVGSAIVIADEKPRISRDGGTTWQSVRSPSREEIGASSERLQGFMARGDGLMAKNWSSESLYYAQQNLWRKIPLPDGVSAKVMAVERSGRLMVIHHEGSSWPGPETIWVSDDLGAHWRMLLRELRCLDLIQCSEGMAVLAWDQPSAGTRILLPGAETFVHVRDERHYIYEHGFALDTGFMLFTSDYAAWLRLGSDGTTLAVGVCDLGPHTITRGDLLDLIELPGNPRRLYGWTRQQGIIRSVDGGTTWQASVGILAALGHVGGEFIRWGPDGNQLLLKIRDSAVPLYLLDDRDGAPGLFPAPVTW